MLNLFFSEGHIDTVISDENGDETERNGTDTACVVPTKIS